MKLNIDKKLLSTWGWVLYPVTVAVMILLSSSFVFSGNFWQGLANRQSEVDLNGLMVSNLKAKLAVLQSSVQSTEDDNIQFLLGVKPAIKPLSPLVSILRQAGSTAGTALVSFRGSVGDINASESAVVSEADTNLFIVTTYTVASPAQLLSLLTSIEKSLPLVRIKDVNYQGDSADVHVEAFWEALPTLSGQTDVALPNPTLGLTKLRQDLSGYTSVTVVDQVLDGPTTQSPF